MKAEPPDHHSYGMVTFDNDTFKFYLEALKRYEAILNEDLEAIDADPDLKFLLDRDRRDSFAVTKEIGRIQRTREWMEEILRRNGDTAFGHTLGVSHGWVRVIKAVSLLYLSALRKKREAIASRPRISRHALEAVDQQLAHFDEKTRMGVFQNATPMPLLAKEYQEVQGEVHVVDEALPEQSEQRRLRPIVLDSIEIFDAELRGRCLDLLEQFHENGEPERLDTVIAEATRILENRLRQLSGAGNDIDDVPKYCFGSTEPKLIVSEHAGEQKAAHLLFLGVFGYVRNPPHHRLIEGLTTERVVQIVGMIDYLLFVAEGARKASV